MASSTRPGRKAWRSANDGRTDGPVTGEKTEHRVGEDVIVAWHWRGGHDRTLVLVHGIGMGQQYFGLLRDKLVDSFDVVAIDLPGFGHSPEPTRQASMPELARHVAHALDELQLAPIVAVGHSMGTQVVAELAVQRPDLVDLLVLIAPTVDARHRTKRSQTARLLLDLLNDPLIVSVVGLKMYVQAGPRWFLTQFDAMLDHRIESIAARIRQPTLVIRGTGDVVSGRGWVRGLAGLIPNAIVREAKGKGHEAMITGAEPVSNMIEDFVRGASS